MALEGLGSKMMIHRATEFSKDASQMQKRSDLMQSAAQKQAQTDAEMQARQVTDVNKASEAVIQRERERRQQQDEELEYVVELEEDEDEIFAPPRPKQPLPEVAQRRRKLDIRI